ncbi:hypothetical protein NHX12_000128 [Muraenolepis orangiensis]|uniref:Alpha-1,2-Mannosidase n=1 Tax=Muraenolepis orangiensis TaxID=630683 RepID=A0A9Q0D828_9TELE|nr:hypothetical protein NHX12_000136 [Muraenolepis orangiensis]KAJ3582897.1 hypothetical protein NHX12_000128 [Muraenolepis orangiensis]
MESFFLGETLKYLYLLFSNDTELLSLDKGGVEPKYLLKRFSPRFVRGGRCFTIKVPSLGGWIGGTEDEFKLGNKVCLYVE